MPHLLNHYQMIRRLGSGGFGEVWLVSDRRALLSPLRAMKRLNPPSAVSQDILSRIRYSFEREARILKKLNGTHNQIPQLYDYFEEGGQLYLVQEFIEGDNLSDVIKQDGKFTEGLARQFLIDALPVLEHLHTHDLIHRDIKPRNIIIRDCDNKPVFVDFGIAKADMTVILDTNGHPATFLHLGTPGYTAPEQWEGRAVSASDLFSLGRTTMVLSELPW